MLKLQILVIFACLTPQVFSDSILDFMKIKGYRYSRLDGTCNNKAPIRVYFTGVRSEGSVIHVNMTCNVSEDLTRKFKAHIEVQRCSSKENPDSCEEYYKPAAFNPCLALKSRSPFAIKMEPEFDCPPKKGTYKLNDASFDTKAFVMFRLDKWFWKIKCDVFEEGTKRLVFCLRNDIEAITR